MSPSPPLVHKLGTNIHDIYFSFCPCYECYERSIMGLAMGCKNLISPGGGGKRGPSGGTEATDSSRLLPTSCQGKREQQIVLACFQLPCRLKAFANCVLIMYMSQKYRFFLSWLLLINTFFLYEELGKS